MIRIPSDKLNKIRSWNNDWVIAASMRFASTILSMIDSKASSFLRLRITFKGDRSDQIPQAIQAAARRIRALFLVKAFNSFSLNKDSIHSIKSILRG